MQGLRGNDQGKEENKPKPSRGMYPLGHTANLHATASRANDANPVLHIFLDTISHPLTSATKTKEAFSTVRSIFTLLWTVSAVIFKDVAEELAPLTTMWNAHARSEPKRSREIVHNGPSKKQALPKLMIQDCM